MNIFLDFNVFACLLVFHIITHIYNTSNLNQICPVHVHVFLAPLMGTKIDKGHRGSGLVVLDSSLTVRPSKASLCAKWRQSLQLWSLN